MHVILQFKTYDCSTHNVLCWKFFFRLCIAFILAQWRVLSETMTNVLRTVSFNGQQTTDLTCEYQRAASHCIVCARGLVNKKKKICVRLCPILLERRKCHILWCFALTPATSFVVAIFCFFFCRIDKWFLYFFYEFESHSICIFFSFCRIDNICRSEEKGNDIPMKENTH